jgi:predicted secreted protein
VIQHQVRELISVEQDDPRPRATRATDASASGSREWSRRAVSHSQQFINGASRGRHRERGGEVDYEFASDADANS